MSETLQEIMEMVEIFWLDHEPDGWPAIRMDQVTALYHAVIAERAENERLRERVAELTSLEAKP